MADLGRNPSMVAQDLIKSGFVTAAVLRQVLQGYRRKGTGCRADEWACLVELLDGAEAMAVVLASASTSCAMLKNAAICGHSLPPRVLDRLLAAIAARAFTWNWKAKEVGTCVLALASLRVPVPAAAQAALDAEVGKISRNAFSRKGLQQLVKGCANLGSRVAKAGVRDSPPVLRLQAAATAWLRRAARLLPGESLAFIISQFKTLQWAVPFGVLNAAKAKLHAQPSAMDPMQVSEELCRLVQKLKAKRQLTGRHATGSVAPPRRRNLMAAVQRTVSDMAATHLASSLHCLAKLNWKVSRPFMEQLFHALILAAPAMGFKATTQAVTALLPREMHDTLRGRSAAAAVPAADAAPRDESERLLFQWLVPVKVQHLLLEAVEREAKGMSTWQLLHCFRGLQSQGGISCKAWCTPFQLTSARERTRCPRKNSALPSTRSRSSRTEAREASCPHSCSQRCLAQYRM
jgi:hypothetical protein